MSKDKIATNIMQDPTMDLKKLQAQIVEEIKAGKSLLGQEGLLTYPVRNLSYTAI